MLARFLPQRMLSRILSVPLLLSHEQGRPWLVGRSAGTALQPRCITRTTKVEVVPLEDVTADCAAAEGDGTLAAWKKAHRKAFAAACEEIGRNFDESMKCVCEYFDVVYRADGQ